MEVLEPRPLDGGWRWVASPAQKTRPFEYVSAYISLTVQAEDDLIVTGMSSSPTSRRTTDSAYSVVRSGAPAVTSYPHTIIHSFHGRTQRTRPAPMPPTVAPGARTQYRVEGRWAVYFARSASKTMLMLPATPIWPPIGSPACSATLERPPSAPIRYFARISYVS